MAINLSIPNILFKLQLFGMPGAFFFNDTATTEIYTLVAVGATVWAARRPRQPEAQPLVWLAILIIASLRSPFLPLTYGTIPALWLLTLVAAKQMPRADPHPGRRGICRTKVTWPDWPIDPRILALVSLVPLVPSMALIRILVAHLLWRADAPVTYVPNTNSGPTVPRQL
jgi:hypothetical protein